MITYYYVFICIYSLFTNNRIDWQIIIIIIIGKNYIDHASTLWKICVFRSFFCCFGYFPGFWAPLIFDLLEFEGPQKPAKLRYSFLRGKDQVRDGLCITDCCNWPTRPRPPVEVGQSIKMNTRYLRDNENILIAYWYIMSKIGCSLMLSERERQGRILDEPAIDGPEIPGSALSKTRRVAPKTARTNDKYAYL